MHTVHWVLLHRAYIDQPQDCSVSFVVIYEGVWEAHVRTSSVPKLSLARKVRNVEPGGSPTMFIDDETTKPSRSIHTYIQQPWMAT